MRIVFIKLYFDFPFVSGDAHHLVFGIGYEMLILNQGSVLFHRLFG